MYYAKTDEDWSISMEKIRHASKGVFKKIMIASKNGHLASVNVRGDRFINIRARQADLIHIFYEQTKKVMKFIDGILRIIKRVDGILSSSDDSDDGRGFKIISSTGKRHSLTSKRDHGYAIKHAPPKAKKKNPKMLELLSIAV